MLYVIAMLQDNLKDDLFLDHGYCLKPREPEQDDQSTRDSEDGSRKRAPARRSTRIQENELREKAEKIKQENLQKEQEALTAMGLAPKPPPQVYIYTYITAWKIPNENVCQLVLKNFPPKNPQRTRNFFSQSLFNVNVNL